MKKQKMRREDNISPNNRLIRTEIFSFRNLPKLDRGVLVLSVITFIICLIIIVLTKKDYISVINSDISVLVFLGALAYSSAGTTLGIGLVLVNIIVRIMYK